MTLHPQRTEGHCTDTLAMKKVSLALGADLLLRSVDERDYGVDALVERYDPSGAGQFLLFQVKGCQDAINANGPTISLGGFPRRTVLYAEEFVHPFIVAYTSVAGGSNDQSPIYYLWLQRYVEHHLEPKDPEWRTDPQATMTLYLPSKNVLSNDLDRIKRISATSMFEKQSYRIFRAVARLQALASMSPDPTYLAELAWIMSAISRSPMVTQRFDDSTAPLRDIVNAVRLAYALARQNTGRNAAMTQADADQMLVLAVQSLERRMSGMLAQVLAVDTYPSGESW